MKNIDPTFNYKQYQRCTSTKLRYFRIFLIKLVVQLKESFIHQNFNHFVQVTSLIQKFCPTTNFFYYIFFHKGHALWATMTIENCEKTYKFPLGTSDVLLNYYPIFHRWPKPYIRAETTVKSGKLKREISNL
jgi:hypothetical protein